MKKFFSFGKGRKRGLSPSGSDTGSVLSAGYELQDKDLGKLHRAALTGELAKIKQLLKKHDINQQDKANRTPLHLACANGQSDAVTLLVESNAKVNLCDTDNRSPLMKAIQCQQESCASILLGHDADPNVVDNNGNAALHFAARIPSISIASQLLEHGADINAPTKEGCTPLMLAVIENNEEMVEFLIKEGANVNSKDVNERTPLMFAASNGHNELVKILLHNDTDISTQDEKGWTADDHAVMNGHHACSHLIIEHSSRKKSSDPYEGGKKKKGASVFSNSSKGVEGVFTLGSPATDKQELQQTPQQTSAARDSGKVTDDFSQVDSERSTSQRSAAADSWPSSDDDFDFSPQKAPKPNLKKLFHTKTNVNQKDSITSAQPVAFSLQNKSNSEDESFRASDDEDPPQPRHFPQAISFPRPVQFTPGSFAKLSQMPSSLFSLNKVKSDDMCGDIKKGASKSHSCFNKPDQQACSNTKPISNVKDAEPCSVSQRENKDDGGDQASDQNEEDNVGQDVSENVEESQDEDNASEKEAGLSDEEEEGGMSGEDEDGGISGEDEEGGMSGEDEEDGSGEDEEGGMSGEEDVAQVSSSEEGIEQVSSNEEDKYRKDVKCKDEMENGESDNDNGQKTEDFVLQGKAGSEKEQDKLDSAFVASNSIKQNEDNNKSVCFTDEIQGILSHSFQDTKAISDCSDVPVSLIIGFYEIPDVNTVDGVGSDVTSLTSGLKSQGHARDHREMNEQTLQDCKQKTSLMCRTGSETIERDSNSPDKPFSKTQNNKESVKNGQVESSLKGEDATSFQSAHSWGVSSEHDDPSDDEGDDKECSEFEDHIEEGAVKADLASSLTEDKLQGAADPVGRKVTLMSELGLEEDDVESPWDSEASLESPRKQSSSKLAHTSNEDLYYSPSFLSPSRNCKMPTHDVWQSFGQSELSKKSTDVEINKKQTVSIILPAKDVSPKYPYVKASESNVKSDLMADLGLDDADDIEDVSDWDSTSHSPKYTTTTTAHKTERLTQDLPLEAKPRTTAPEPMTVDLSSSLPPVPQEEEEEDDDDDEDDFDEKHVQSVLKENVLNSSKRDFEQMGENNDSLKKTVLTQVNPSAVVEDMLKVANLTVGNEVSSHVQNKVTSQQPCEPKMVQSVDYNLESSSSDSEPPWEERYEKLWVDREKKEVKTHFKEVAAELKHKFGEITETKKKETISILDNPNNGKNEMHNMDIENTATLSSSQENVCLEKDNALLTMAKLQPRMDLIQSNSQTPDSTNDQVGEDFQSSDSILLGTDAEKNLLEIKVNCDQFPGTDKTGGAKHSGKKESNLFFTNKNGDFKLDVSSVQIKNYLQESFPSTTEEREKNILEFNTENKGCRLLQSSKPGSTEKKTSETQTHVNLHHPQQSELDSSQLLQVPLENTRASQSFSEVHRKPLDKQLEQDMQRFKNEVYQKENEKPQSVQMKPEGDDACDSGKEVQKTPVSSDLQDKPKQMARHGQFKGKDATMLDGSKRTRKPIGIKIPFKQQKATTNGNLLDIYDDSTFSETSQEDNGRDDKFSKDKDKIDDGDEFDELSQSSDTTTDVTESPTFKNAMLLVEQLNVDGQDSLNLLKIQDIIRKYERSLQKENGRYSLLLRKVKKMESNHKDLQQITEKNRELKSVLDHQKLEWESDLNHLRFMLKQEEEKRKSAEILYEKSREQLRKKEDQCCTEMEDKQQLEMTVRNMERELRSLSNTVKQAEEERNEAQRLLSQERNARVLQEDFLNNLRRKNEEEAAKIILSKSVEVHSQPSETTEREKDLSQRNHTLQEEITLLKQELEKVQCQNEEEKRQYLDENEVLKEKVDDLKRDLKINEEALTQNLIQYNGQLNALKTEATIFCTKLEHEKQAKERLETELELFRSRLNSTQQDQEKSQMLKTEVERTFQRERDEWMRSKDKLDHELSSIRENNKNLSQQLSRAEAKSNELECDLHRRGLSFQEKVVLLESTQRDLTQAQCRIKELESTLQTEKDQINKNTIILESRQERLAQIQSENMQLRQQLEDMQSKGIFKDKLVTDAQDKFTDIFSKLRADTERQVHLVEERNKDLINKSNELREQVYRLETEKVEGESARRQLQQELADAFKKLSMSEASLEVITRYRNDLEEEKQNLQKEVEKCRNKLQDLEDQFIQSERLNHQLKNLLDDKEREIVVAVQKAQEFSTATAAAEKSAKQLEEHVQKLEIENAKIEATAKHQTTQIEILQRELQESVSNRNRMEDLLTGLQSSKMGLEEKLNQQVSKQTALSMNAHESHSMWEEELKSRSRLGIRLAELDREKSDLVEQVDRERKKVKKLAEMKKSVESRFDQEVKRNSELHRDLTGMKKLLKTTKKKLKEFESLGHRQSRPEDGSAHKSIESDSERSRLKDKIEQLSVSLERESMRYKQLESANRDLQEQLYSIKHLHRKHERQEKGQRHLEGEVADLKRHLESSKMDQSTMEHFKREIEERGRQELRQKLEEVNLFLQTQAAAQDSLEQIRSATDASLRSQLESRIQDLESELHKIKSQQKESECQKESSLTELDRFKDLYTEEMKLRKVLASKLERTSEKLEEANTKLLTERQRSKSLIASSIVNGSLATSPILDSSQLGLHGRNLAMNGGFGLGGSFLSSTGNGLTVNRIDSYLAQMHHDLEKSIAKELQQGNSELETGYTRVPPVGSTAATFRNPDTDLDPVSRTAQQYLEVLKKNYMI
ncbi:ankyrin repeat domain-containing protein 26 [Pelobates fuscus]|uniref:ankyrin repeat domain-containing protein 26 n=1 Tax=Pelobates fuscus TaxID=191477 RepID=UPI002FE45FEA